MKKFLTMAVLSLVLSFSPHASAYLLDVEGTHYELTLVTGSYDYILANTAYSFEDNPWWASTSRAHAFAFANSVNDQSMIYSGHKGTKFAVNTGLAWGNDFAQNECQYFLGESDCLILARFEEDTQRVEYGINYFGEGDIYAFASHVSEPATFALAGIGIAGLALTRRRKLRV